LIVLGKAVNEFAKTGRKRWLVENERFSIQKNHQYIITHANSLNDNAIAMPITCG